MSRSAFVPYAPLDTLKEFGDDLPKWQTRYPDTRSYGVPGLAEKAKRPIRIDEVL